MTIRPAVESDYPFIHAATKRLFESHAQRRDIYAVPAADAIDAEIRNATVLLVADDTDGRTVGFVRGRINDAPQDRGAPFAILHDLFVEEDCRRRGIGSALTDAFMNDAKRRSAAHVELSVDTGNPEALGFWRAKGFMPFQERLFRIA